ncbi:MAG: L,D-transpeptidase family protein [Ilumatobacteraceae bacterium]
MNSPRPPAPRRRRPPQQPGQQATAARWLPAVAAGGVLLVVVVAGMSGGGGSASDDTAIPAADSAVVDSGLTVPASTQPNIVVESTVSPITKTTLSVPLTPGAAGDEVKMVQQRLTDLGFAPGPVDGFYGSGTQQAVWAYKKLVGGMDSYLDLARSDSASTVSPEMWQAMQDPIVIQPQRPLGAGSTHVEIYLPLQVLIVFTDDVPTLIAHISSGELDEQGQPKLWCEVLTYDTDNQGRPLTEPRVADECAYAKTPGGVFKFTRRVEGNRLGPLGGMYNPVYFNYGIAVHGAKNVPKVPASHGCIRLNMDIAEYFPSLVDNGDRVYVWGHDGRQPEDYSKKDRLPSFNAPNPNSTTTSSSTTTTTTATATTTPATTTTKPPPTTTTAAPTTTADPPPTTGPPAP